MKTVVADTLPQLDYASGAGRPRRRHFRRNLAVVVILGLLGYFGWQAGPALLDNLRALRAQRQCMAYVAPADQVVSAEPLPVLWDTTYLFARPDPACLTALEALAEGTVFKQRPSPVVFMHERRTKRGQRRLVIVRRVSPAERQSIDIPLSFLVTLVEPGTIRVPPNSWTFMVADPISLSFPDDPKVPPALRMFAGRPDSADASRFTIGYEANGNVGEIEGELIQGENAETDANEGLTVELRRGG